MIFTNYHRDACDGRPFNALPKEVNITFSASYLLYRFFHTLKGKGANEEYKRTPAL